MHAKEGQTYYEEKCKGAYCVISANEERNSASNARLSSRPQL